jgi:hypothetical protein
MTNESIPIASSKAGISAPQGTASRTRVLLHGPIVLTLLRLGPPNIVVNVVLIAVTASVDAHFIGRFGPNALAGISLVFPLIMLMQQVANSSMGGAIAAAVARAIGAGRHGDASALVIHGVIIAAGMAAIFALVLLIGGPTIYRLIGGSGEVLAAALELKQTRIAIQGGCRHERTIPTVPNQRAQSRELPSRTNDAPRPLPYQARRVALCQHLQSAAPNQTPGAQGRP